MILETGRNESDLGAAVALITRTFRYERSFFNESYFTDDPDFSLQDLVLARDVGNRLVGVVRIQPKTFMRRERRYRSAGINFVCIDEEYRGKGFSRPLMLLALSQIKKRGFELSYVIARRAVDNYYNKFGYWGASSYQKLHIKRTGSDSNGDLTVKGVFDQDCVDVYKRAYDHSYASCFGRSVRSGAQWRYFARIIRSMEHVAFNTVFYRKEPIGYFIDSDNVIRELAVVGKVWDERICASGALGASENCVVEIPFDHSVVPYVADMDVTYSSRRCLNGGHMLKVMGDESEKNLSFDEFQQRLRINAGVPRYREPSSDFNISFPDQL